MPRPTRLIAAAAVAVLSLAAAACSSGGGAKPTSTAPARTVAPAASATPVPAALATAVAQGGKVPLAPFTDPDKRYTVKLPEGWVTEPIANAITAYVPGKAGGPAATLSIFCAPGITADALITQDQNAGRNLGTGGPDLSNATATQVAGVPGRLIVWTSSLQSIKIEHVTVYFAGKGCAWRIQLNTFPGVALNQFRPVLDGVLASFAFT